MTARPRRVWTANDVPSREMLLDWTWASIKGALKATSQSAKLI